MNMIINPNQLATEVMFFTYLQRVYEDNEVSTFFLYDNEDVTELVENELRDVDVSLDNEENWIIDLNRFIFKISNVEIFCPFATLLSDSIFNDFMDVIIEVCDNFPNDFKMAFFLELIAAINRNLWRDLTTVLNPIDYMDLADEYPMMFAHFETSLR